jgi:hypothetical protein
MKNVPKRLDKEKADGILDLLLEDMGAILDVEKDFRITLAKTEQEITVKIADFYGNVFIKRIR